MRIYVTGMAGFLGSWIAEELRYDHYVAGCDNFAAGEARNIPVGLVCRDVDCLYRHVIVKELEGFDVVYHCAAHPHEGLSVFSPYTICRSIYEASVSVFSAAIAAGVRRIVYCSSMSRYGDGVPPFSETQKTMPVDPYAIAKVAAEQTLVALCKTHGVEYVIAVPHNIVGPRQKYDDPFRNVAAIMANRLLQDMDPIVYGDGQQTRCFSDVRDVVEVMAQLATDPRAAGEVFNVGPDEETISIEDLGKRLSAIVGTTWHPIRLPDRPCEVKHASCSSDKIREWYGYKTKYTLQQSLKLLVEYIKQRGPRPFSFYLPVEIQNEVTPKFWTQEVM